MSVDAGFAGAGMETPGWVSPENPALARDYRPLGMPLTYAALLLMAALQIGLSLKLYVPGLVIFLVGWGVGVLLTRYDPYAWELFTRSVRVPKELVP